MKTRSVEDQINEIMDWFNFNKVAKAMKALDWTWASTGLEPPHEGQIREMARNLLIRACDDWHCATGGFVARCDEETGDLTLEFHVSSWTAERESR